MCGFHGRKPIGNSQLKRNLLVRRSKPSPEFCKYGAANHPSCVTRLNTTNDPFSESDQIQLASSGSGIPHSPSPPAVTIHSLFWIPEGSSEFDGPHQPLLSCKPPQTV